MEPASTYFVMQALLFSDVAPFSTSPHMRYKDIHCHRRPASDDVESIVNNLVDAATEDLLDDLPCSVGVHPRSIDGEIDDTILFMRDLAHAESVLAIGECGLDRSIPVPWADQMRVFEDQISISELLCKPLIIHCVRAHADVVALHRDLHPVQPWIVHGFNKGGDVLERLVEAGIYVSFGAAIMQADSPAAQAMATVADDMFLLETDDQTDVDIAAIYARAAELRGVSVETLCETLQKTFDSVFRP